MSHSSILIKPKEGLLAPPICSQLVRSTDLNLGFREASEVCVLAEWGSRLGAGVEQSSRTEPITSGI